MNIYRSICLSVCLYLTACASSPQTPAPTRTPPSATAPTPQSQVVKPATPKTKTSATFALLSNADEALDAEQPKKAILLLERAVRIEPRNFELWIRLSRAHLATNNLVAATQHARKAIALVDADVGPSAALAKAKAWLQYAEVLEYAGQQQEAASIRRRYNKRRG